MSQPRHKYQGILYKIWLNINLPNESHFLPYILSFQYSCHSRRTPPIQRDRHCECFLCRGGTWSTGGRCDQEVRPLTDEEVEQMQTPPWTNPLIVDAINDNVKSKRSAVEFVDVTPSTDYRADGHGGLYTRDVAVYGVTPRSQQDCSHFCLPGVPDTWNEFLYATLLARGQGVWGERVQ